MKHDDRKPTSTKYSLLMCIYWELSSLIAVIEKQLQVERQLQRSNIHMWGMTGINIIVCHVFVDIHYTVAPNKVNLATNIQ